MCFSCLHIYVKILNCYSPFTCENFVQGEDSPSLCEFLELDDVHTPAGHDYVLRERSDQAPLKLCGSATPLIFRKRSSSATPVILANKATSMLYRTALSLLYIPIS